MNPYASPLPRRLFLAVVLACAWLPAAHGTFAASSGDLDLSGTVATQCDVTVTATATAANLDLSTAGVSVNVGSVNETCNDPDGYTVTAQSANSSVLSPIGTSTDSVPYTFDYDATTFDLSGGGAVTVTDVNAATGAAGVDRTVTIDFAAPGFIAADTYTDTLTFTIAAK